MGRSTQGAIAEAVRDALAGGGQFGREIIPAAVSAAMTSQSLGGLLQRLFGYTFDSRETPYIYAPTDYPIASSATLGIPVQSQIVVTQDSDFVCSKMTVLSGVANTGTMDVQVQFLFTNTDRLWSSQQFGVNAVAIAGTGQLPYILPKPWLVSRNTRVNVVVTSGSANSRSIYIDWHGYRVYDVSALDLTTKRS